MEEKKILVVDDEEGIRDIIKEYAEAEGYIVIEAIDGVDAMNKFKQESYELVILDIMMPKMDGWKVCREIRKTSQVPIIMLTARGEEYDKLFGFELGVDDYIVKPFSPRELMARAKVAMGRRIIKESEPKEKLLVFGGLSLSPEGRDLRIDGVIAALTPKEFDLILYFMENPGIAFSREQLLSAVWGYDYFGDNRTIDTHVKMLREHLGAYRGWLSTVWGVGYKFQPEVEK